ncbi:enoyl-CoA hydratase-related protein [Prosthecomicrobium pneumaticum]|uniref:Enoyl-CoA hydratase/carnithine racemase n=1 Tax=Prosthecomicrobium pneumaticum TaxID=81895 RepID=A0A7W9CVE7_9HYPH|nr:enoyl-CoA hydratase-related protein [Prosthecomicrobium pneumaticum]MBB5752072.1 enoyl-CoA hydratase/carnithine racemase [Prosthecomicrobium pneumaticum]
MSAQASMPIHVENRAGVVTIRFDRPETQNAWTLDMLGALADALVIGERDGRVRAFMLSGTPGVFCSGSELKEILAFADRGALDEVVTRFLKTIATIEKPLVAAVDGPAVGIGATILFHCDYVVASEWSTFECPSVELGLVPEAASTLIGPRLMGYARAFEFLVMGERFDAERAREVGLVNRILPAEAVDDAALEVARSIARKPPEAVTATRRLIRGDRREILARVDQEAALIVERLRSPLARDNVIAFMRKAR